jgi:hypothetical protein
LPTRCARRCSLGVYKGLQAGRPANHRSVLYPLIPECRDPPCEQAREHRGPVGPGTARPMLPCESSLPAPAGLDRVTEGTRTRRRPAASEVLDAVGRRPTISSCLVTARSRRNVSRSSTDPASTPTPLPGRPCICSPACGSPAARPAATGSPPPGARSGASSAPAVGVARYAERSAAELDRILVGRVGKGDRPHHVDVQRRRRWARVVLGGGRARLPGSFDLQPLVTGPRGRVATDDGL